MKSKYIWFCQLIGFLATLHANISQASDCLQRATTPLEQAYCKIKAEGEGNQLPGLEDFKKNTPLIQRLLLKKDAKKLGIKLADAPTKKKSKTNRDKAASKKTPAEKNKSAKNLRPNTTEMNTPKNNTPVRSVIDPLSISNCILQAKGIKCQDKDYSLQSNQTNKDIDPDALLDKNQLDLSHFSGDPSNEKEVAHYLFNAYKIYIEKMIYLGLAEATMTYTKFHHTFHHAAQHKTDFSGRFTQMYQYLKQDKQKMAVQRKANVELPTNLEFCSHLSKTIIVCDQGGGNLIFIQD